MLAEQHLRDGNLEECLQHLQEDIRKDPSNVKYRIFLFQLLAVLGQWQRAMTQLDVIKELDVSAWPMVQTYREALLCELLRSEIFAGRHTPLVFGDPQQWIALLLESLRLSAEGQYGNAETLRGEAFELAPATPGNLNGENFNWIGDADSRLGPVLEVIVNGAYYWVPYHQIKNVSIEEPEDLRDFVWIPAHFMWTNGGEAVGLIPTLYVNSTESQDAKIRMGRRTEWIEQSSGHFVGMGQRILTTDVNEYSLLDIRYINLDADQNK